MAGECQTQYTSEDNDWYNKLIKKSKNLLGCKGRQSANSAIQGIPYTSNSVSYLVTKSSKYIQNNYIVCFCKRAWKLADFNNLYTT